MNATIYYYTGTGNTLWVGRLLAKELGDAELAPIAKVNGRIDTDAEIIGLIFPVYIWGPPGRVVDFLDKLPKDNNKYYFAVATNGGQIAGTLTLLKKMFEKRDLRLSSGYEILMPSNYIPWGGPIAEDEQKKRFENAESKVKQIIAPIKAKEINPVEKGPLWQNLLFSVFYKLSFDKVPEMDKKFWLDDKCNSCGICEKVCVAKNIELKEGKPVWRNRCEQCMACIQWCPKEAIQNGKKTPEYKRYTHPEIKLKDIMDSVPGNE